MRSALMFNLHAALIQQISNHHSWQLCETSTSTLALSEELKAAPTRSA